MTVTAISEVTIDRARKKHETFKKLAEKRTNAIVEKIRVLGNLANRRAYDYSETDVRKMFNAIEKELRAVRANFRTAERRQFHLD